MKRFRKITELTKADEGTILAFWGVSFAVLFGIVAMSFDMGRIGITQSELQAYADNVALAAAGELDGGATAITRAQAAAANMIADTQTFGNGNNALAGAADYSLVFLSDLPACDSFTACPPTDITTNPADAIFAWVTVANHNVDLTFAAAFSALTGAGTPANSVSARAIAGFTGYACDITPLFFCLPSPTYTANGNIGSVIELRAGKQGAAWAPGDFGFLDLANIPVDPNGPCASLNGAKKYACVFGAVGSISQCYQQRGVDMEPGQKSGMTDGTFNVRFDVFHALGNQLANDPNYAPAPNVIKDTVATNPSCNPGSYQPVTTSAPLPPDDCMTAGTCGRVGDGIWTAGRANYEALNYGGAGPSSGATRYQYYLDEIASAGGPASSTPILTGRDQTGRPMCASTQSTDVDRRTLIAAGVDCAANSFSGSATGIPVLEYFKMFMIQPARTVGSGPNKSFSIYGEVIGSAGGAGGGAGSNGLFYDVIQLYR